MISALSCGKAPGTSSRELKAVISSQTQSDGLFQSFKVTAVIWNHNQGTQNNTHLTHITIIAIIIAIPISPNTTASTILVVAGSPTTSSLSFKLSTVVDFKVPGAKGRLLLFSVMALDSSLRKFSRFTKALSVGVAPLSPASSVNFTSTLPV